MKSKFFFATLLLFSQIVYGQYTFVSPNPGVIKTCHVDVNDATKLGNSRDDIKRAVFKYGLTGGGSCTGTLINRNTAENSIGIYFITAWHCFKSNGAMCSGSDYNFNQFITFYFNFQSPPNNLGSVYNENSAGNIDTIIRKVRLVQKINCAEGDFALCEVLGKPIPPHYNVYYAGWEPNIYPNGNSFINISHPKGSIKKAAKPDNLKVSPGTSVKNNCRMISGWIDSVVGFFTGKTWSTREVCDIFQIPFQDTRYWTHGYSWGNTEGGSSGSPLLSNSNRIVGQLSGGEDISCGYTNGLMAFGGFADGYTKPGVRAALNPAYSRSVDLDGIPGRQINCYDAIDYNYTNANVNIYPASLYQASNNIVMNSKTSVKLGGNGFTLTVRTGANLTFNAGTYLEFQDGLDIQQGATFTANIGSPCSQSGTYRTEEDNNIDNYEQTVKEKMIEKMKAIKMPKKSQSTFSLTPQFKVKVYPNPSNGQFNYLAESIAKEGSDVNIQLFDLYGNKLIDINNNAIVANEQYSLDLSALNGGIYTIRFADQDGNHHEDKLIIVK